MTLTETTFVRAAPMADMSKEETKTVRLPGELVNQLQTISAMETEMGQRFKVVEFLAELVAGPIVERYADTYQRFTEFKAAKVKESRRRKPSE